MIGARVRTGDRRRSTVTAVGVVDGRIAALGTAGDVRRRLGAGAEVLTFPGATVVPGLVDPHVHLFGMATRGARVDCAALGRARELLQVVARVASRLPAGAWVRGDGLDDTLLDRLPLAAELEEAAPRNPVRLRHRSRHASLLSCSAMRMMGASLPRRARRGAGLIVGREQAIGHAVGPLPRAELAAGLADVSTRLVARGVTALGDATPRGGRGWAPVIEEMAAGRFLPRVSGMRPVGVRPFPGRERLTAGPIKIMVEEEGTGLRPRPATLARLVARAAASGERVAVHCLGASTLVAAVEAFAQLPARGRRRARHRLEHVAECPAPLVERIAALGLTVVTNPAFVALRGDVYRAETSAEAHGGIYRAGSLERAGVPLAGASDAPVSPCDPWLGMAAARQRLTASGARLGWSERLSARSALALFTTGAAAALGDDRLGRIVPGGPADLVVVDRDPLRTAAEALADTQVLLTMIDGEVAGAR